MQRTFKILSKSQADGAQTFSLTGYERARIHQLQIDLSATPTAGTMDISIRTPGASDYVSLGDIDLVNGPLAATFEGYCDSVRITPTGFDAGKTYSAYLFSLQV
jgi:hypothetical protein